MREKVSIKYYTMFVNKVHCICYTCATEFHTENFSGDRDSEKSATDLLPVVQIPVVQDLI